VDKIIDRHNCDPSALIQILLEIQAEKRWLSKPTLMWVAERLGVPLSRVMHIATFYKAFSLEPHGRHLVQVCLGTACHVRGAQQLLNKVTMALGIKPGETDSDMKFTFKTVNCLGCCALGPVVMIDEKYYSDPSVDEIKKISEDLE
ncbi:MAG: NAD(P)H-dependent oxidoreductase subunit E, partial [Deltaproteobacteria bacterium]